MTSKSKTEKTDTSVATSESQSEKTINANVVVHGSQVNSKDQVIAYHRSEYYVIRDGSFDLTLARRIGNLVNMQDYIQIVNSDHEEVIANITPLPDQRAVTIDELVKNDKVTEQWSMVWYDASGNATEVTNDRSRTTRPDIKKNGKVTKVVNDLDERVDLAQQLNHVFKLRYPNVRSGSTRSNTTKKQLDAARVATIESIKSLQNAGVTVDVDLTNDTAPDLARALSLATSQFLHSLKQS